MLEALDGPASIPSSLSTPSGGAVAVSGGHHPVTCGCSHCFIDIIKGVVTSHPNEISSVIHTFITSRMAPDLPMDKHEPHCLCVSHLKQLSTSHSELIERIQSHTSSSRISTNTFVVPSSQVEVHPPPVTPRPLPKRTPPTVPNLNLIRRAQNHDNLKELPVQQQS